MGRIRDRLFVDFDEYSPGVYVLWVCNPAYSKTLIGYVSHKKRHLQVFNPEHIYRLDDPQNTIEIRDKVLEIFILDKLSPRQNLWLFTDLPVLEKIHGLKKIDTHNITDFSSMFDGCEKLSDFHELAEWDLSQAQSLDAMFRNCASLEDVSFLSQWNTSNVNDFQSMFSQCSTVKCFDAIAGWDISHARNLFQMFCGCMQLEDIEFVRNWDVSNVENFCQMFNRCWNMKDASPAISWDTSSATDLRHVFHCVAPRECLEWSACSLPDIALNIEDEEQGEQRISLKRRELLYYNHIGENEPIGNIGDAIVFSKLWEAFGSVDSTRAAYEAYKIGVPLEDVLA